jgi:hypothetical protein
MMATQKRQAENVTGVSNVAFDLMAVLTNKLEGIAAIQQYKHDAQGDQEVLQCFEQIEQQARTEIETLRHLVVSRLGQ